jgi:hypothetical protein
MNIDQLIAGMQSVIKNPTDLPNYKVMLRLRDKIVNDGDFYFPSTDFGQTVPDIELCAGRCVLAMKIDVSNDEDVDKVVEFLFCGFKIMAKLVFDLCGKYHFETLLKSCSQLEIRC